MTLNGVCLAFLGWDVGPSEILEKKRTLFVPIILSCHPSATTLPGYIKWIYHRIRMPIEAMDRERGPVRGDPRLDLTGVPRSHYLSMMHKRYEQMFWRPFFIANVPISQ